MCSGISYSSCMLSGLISATTAGTSDAAASALSQHCSSACSNLCFASRGPFVPSLLSWNSTLADFPQCHIQSNFFVLFPVRFLEHSNIRAICYRVAAAHSSCMKTKQLFFSEIVRRRMTYPGASLGRGKGRSRGKKGKSGNSLHYISMCILNEQGTTSRQRRSRGSSGRRRRREGEPSAGHRHAQRKRKALD